MPDEKLTDIERDALRKLSAKYMKRAIWTAVVMLGMAACAMWFGDWRFVGIAFVLFMVFAALCVMSIAATSELNEARFAKIFRTAERAKKQRAHQERQWTEGLERDLGMRD
ncbi:hypothetical protein ACIBHX_01905 [Nonomuraea sp. NPDC050536]|uniref:hypothetical protein n=1 Tax=Nonomuraea sp. NPDC050536 TaxID=3364366 RepID=UPI0037C67AB8